MAVLLAPVDIGAVVARQSEPGRWIPRRAFNFAASCVGERTARKNFLRNKWVSGWTDVSRMRSVGFNFADCSRGDFVCMLHAP